MKNSLVFLGVVVVIMSTLLSGGVDPMMPFHNVGCNGSLDLCKRRYNNVAYAYAHNATTRGPSIVNNQNLSLRDLMKRGVRGIKIPVHYKKDFGNNRGEDPWVCHGIYRSTLYKNYYEVMQGKLLSILNSFFNKAKPAIQMVGDINLSKLHIKIRQLPGYLRMYLKGWKPITKMIEKALPVAYGSHHGLPAAVIPFTPCVIDPAARSFKSVLLDIKWFLETYTNNVFTLTIENQIPIEEVGEFIRAIGLSSYAHVQDSKKPWPTLGEMIKKNKRLVIFANNTSSKHPWILRGRKYIWGVVAPREETQKALEAATLLPTKFNNFYLRNKEPRNKIFNVPHFITTGFGGSIGAANKVNRRSVLRKRITTLIKKSLTIPTFISTDFTQLPNGDVFDVVNEINGVGKYKAKPLGKLKRK